ncbi:MAG: hypothetical protein J5867_06040 [Prevotella sp.]|nr:hypothetical protein [Prevotella sp.]
MRKLLLLFSLILTSISTMLMAQVSNTTAEDHHLGGLCMEGDSAYHIRHDIDLGGRHVVLKEGALLVSEGGIIDNGTLIGNNTKIVGDTIQQLFGNKIHISGTWNVVARPEWFGARGDGIAYWDYPLRCYAGNIGSVNVSNTVSPVTVSYPSSHIVNKSRWEHLSAYTTDDVFLDTINHRFLLLNHGVYYAKWANSHEWNDKTNGKARPKTVYSDISCRRSTIYLNGRMVDIDSTMTNNAEAFNRAIILGNGNVILRPMIYYIKMTKDTHSRYHPWKAFDEFHFDGNGATLLLRTQSKGSTQQMSPVAWGWFYQCHHGVIEHLNLRALRDRDDGAPTGHYRMDSGDSRIMAFSLNGCVDLTFRNITFQGMSHDFCIKRGIGNSGDSRDIFIDGWHSELFTQNVFAGVNNCHVDHADLTQAPMVGEGMHVIYGQSYLKGLYVTNSTFRQGDANTSVMLTYHGGTKNSSSCPDNIYYDHCIIEGARMAQGGGGQHQTFRNCIFRQTIDSILVKKTVFNKAVIIGTGVNYTFENCKFELYKSGLINSDFTSSNLQMIMRNCEVNAPKTTIPLIIIYGTIELEDCSFRCGGFVLSDKTSKPKVNNCIKNGIAIPNQ